MVKLTQFDKDIYYILEKYGEWQNIEGLAYQLCVDKERIRESCEKLLTLGLCTARLKNKYRVKKYLGVK